MRHKGLCRAAPLAKRVAWVAQPVVALQPVLDLDLEPDLGLAVAVAVAASKAEVLASVFQNDAMHIHHPCVDGDAETHALGHGAKLLELGQHPLGVL